MKSASLLLCRVQILLFASIVALSGQHANAKSDNQIHSAEQQEAAYETSSGASSSKLQIKPLQKCSRQSVILARQMLMHELDEINSYNSIWFNDLDKDELVEEQKQSLANIIISGLGSTLLDADGRPLIEIETSYFRPFNLNQLPGPGTQIINTPLSTIAPSTARSGQMLLQPQHPQPPQLPQQQHINIKLVRRHPDKCYLINYGNSVKPSEFTYVFGLTIGPIEHHLDVVYNLPKELRLSQPIDWRYAQVRIIVPRLHYEVTLKQLANYKLAGSKLDANVSDSTLSYNRNEWRCPLEMADVAFLNSASAKPQVAVVASGLATTNQTLMHLERLFNDYTRPMVTSRLRQVLKFYLKSKTLPLSTT